MDASQGDKNCHIDMVANLIMTIHSKYDIKINPEVIGQSASAILSERIYEDIKGRLIDLPVERLHGILKASQEMITTNGQAREATPQKEVAKHKRTAKKRKSKKPVHARNFSKRD